MLDKTAQSLWIGKRLSVMEQLTIRSFLDHGYSFHLYTYEDVENIPAGTTVRPAEEIVPRTEIFCYQRGYGKGSFAGFANKFRYKLLFDRGGWWTDLDAVCLKPFDFPDEHVIGYEREPLGEWHVNNAMMKAPPASSLMKYCWDSAHAADPSQLRWGQTGPRLLAKAIAEVNIPVRILDPRAFYPVDHWQTWRFIRCRRIPNDSYSFHLWSSKWRSEGFDPDAVYDPRCIYEQLKKRHGVISPPDAACGDPNWQKIARCWRRGMMYAVVGGALTCGGLARKRIPERQVVDKPRRGS
jgi:hypothetical protein